METGGRGRGSARGRGRGRGQGFGRRATLTAQLHVDSFHPRVVMVGQVLLSMMANGKQ